MPTRLWTALGTCLLVLVACALLAGPVAAEDGKADRGAAEKEIKAVKKKIAELQAAAERAQDAGRAEEAQELATRARDMTRRLEAYFERRAKEKRAHDGAKPKPKPKHKPKPKRDVRREKERGGKRAKEQGKHDGILRGLGNGIEALQALGGHEELVARMQRLHADLKAKGRAARAQPKRSKAGRSERQIVEHWLEVMNLAKKTLQAAERYEFMRVIEHGMHALELALEGRKDAEALRIREAAPSRPQQAVALFMAAEILADKGQKERAQMVSELGKRFRGKARRESGEGERRGGEPAGNRGLRERAEIMRSALPALREGEKRDAAEILERGIRTAEVVLTGRKDDEAHQILGQTPKLGELAEVLHMAGELWMKFGNEDKAHQVLRLAHYYARRERGEDAAWGEHDDGEHREREGRGREGERAEHLEHLRRQMAELREQLERIQRELRELGRDK